MKKAFILFIIVIISTIILAEPYRPKVIIFVHGYNADNVKSSGFGITMKKSENKGDIEHCIAASPYTKPVSGEIVNPFDPSYYVSKFDGDSLEEGKLAALCLDKNSEIINYWADNVIDENDRYWLRGAEIYQDTFYLNNHERPINIFLETIEFDYPGIGSADACHPNSITPTSYQIGRGRQLLCKFKEVLINYYTDGEPYYVYKTINQIVYVFTLTIDVHPENFIVHIDEITDDGKFYTDKHGWLEIGSDYREETITYKRISDVKLKKPDGTIISLKADHLNPDLHNSDPKVIFIAHSYGGVVLRQMLMELDERA